MFERIANSFALARSSWGVLRRNKRLVVFPVLSSLACVLVLLSFLAPFALRPALFDDLKARAPWALGLLAFGFYFASYFVMIFFNAALVACALMRFSGRQPTVGAGLGAALVRLPQIFLWALVSATVGMLLKLIENTHEKTAVIVSAILGTVWTVLTYFVVPVLVVEKVGPFRAVGRSVAILKKTWGGALFGRFGIGFYVVLLALPGVLLLVGGIYLCLATKLLTLGLALAAGAVVYLLLVGAVGAALQGIFVGALYQYAAHGEVPTGFERQTMETAFKTK
jgi:hypothetical protein